MTVAESSVMDARTSHLYHSVNDLAGAATTPIAITDHQLLPWEKRCHALLETFNARGVISMEEKRRGVEDMGQTIYAALTYYEKWVMCAANLLMAKGHITSDELADKVAEVHALDSVEAAHDDHHGHDHEHAPIRAAPAGEWELLEVAVRELAIAKGLITAADHRKLLEYLDAATPALGAKIVARAWLDPVFKQRVIADGNVAWELGATNYDRTHLIVLENTPAVHNLVVCTLCSCYPRPLLGLPPDWYKSPAYRSRAVRWPRSVLAEFGTFIPAHVAIHVHDSNADMRYLVMPMRPAGTDGWSEDQLAALVTRDTMIGVAVPSVQS
ncbi:MAG: nitrile hydratase subunit alpha [Kofleriaceae bacterium]